MDDLLAEFLAETREMLEALGVALVSWEDDPGDRARLDAIFRFFHTVKGNCGFFEFPRLEALSHAAEDALADVRAERRMADPALISAVLAIIDRIGMIVDAIEQEGELPIDDDKLLIAALDPQPDALGDNLQPQHAAGNHEQHKSIAAQRSIRLPIELLDRVMSGVSDMVLARNELARQLRQGSLDRSVEESFERLSSIIADVRDDMTRTRMQRIEGLFAPLPRLVRDLSAELGKQCMVDIEGKDVELDREMIEILRNPLTHIIRNAIDHGIEPATARMAAGKRELGLLSISARQSGNQILIEVVDDGRGIDESRLVEKAVHAGVIDLAEAKRLTGRERVSLIFEPGISTASDVTTISGRGVGMDVVRDNIERIGGAVGVESALGEGTRVTLRVPLTLTIIPALTISIGDQRFAIPRSSVEEIVHVTAGATDVSYLGGAMLAMIRGRRLPCLVLSGLLGLKSEVADEDRTLVVLRLTGGELFALVVDRLHGHEDLVVKPVAPAIIATGIYAGATLADDGTPILLLEATGLARAGGLQLDVLERSARQAHEAEVEQAARRHSVLLFTGLDGIRKAMPMIVVERIEEIDPGAVESDGDRVLAVVRGNILPLAGTECGPLREGTLRLLRLGDGRSEIGYAIEEALEIRKVDAELVPAEEAGDSEGFLLIDDEPTALLAPHKLFARHAREPGSDTPPACHLPAGDSWMQNFMRPMVEAAGYRVIDADEADVDLAIVSRTAAATPVGARQVIRLHSSPDEDLDRSESIYRYDRARLLSELRTSSGKGRR